MGRAGEKLAYIVTLYSSKPEFQIDDSGFILFLNLYSFQRAMSLFVNDVTQQIIQVLHSVKAQSRSYEHLIKKGLNA